MKLILVRHGMPDEDDAARPHDPPINATGRRQARRLAEHLAHEGVDRIVSSPLLRAKQTAEPLGRVLDLRLELLDGLAEADRDAPRYRSIESLRALGPDTWNEFLQDPVRFFGGDPGSFRSAVLGAIEQVLNYRDTTRVVVFTHGLPINLILSHALGLPRLTHFAPRHCSITRLRGDSVDSLGVVSVNETIALGSASALRPRHGSLPSI